MAAEIQAKIPSSTRSPRKTYSMKGSMLSASWARMSSSALVVSSWVLVEYGLVFSTVEIRSWSKKSWPTQLDWAV